MSNAMLAGDMSPSTSDLQTWRPLRHFNYYRLLLALALLFLFYNAAFGGFLGKYHSDAFLASSLLFLVSSVIFILISIKRMPGFQAQVIISNASDIVFITLMTHYSGGLGSALGILVIINITATATFLRSRDAYSFAALASLAVLIEQTYDFLNGITSSNAFSIAGMLGMVFFGSSWLASILARRVKESEALASQRTVDLINLEKLNENIIQNMRTGIMVVDKDGHVRLANNSAESLLGDISLQDNPLLENVFPALDARFLEWQSQPQMHHQPIRQPQGLPDIQPGFRKLDHSSNSPGDTLIFLEDASQLSQRFQQIKLASLGRLTASIAHEIRNPLSGINHAAQLLNETELDPADRKLTQIINTQVQRLDKIIQNVLQISRQEQSTPESIELNQWLETFKQEYCANHKLKPEQITIQHSSDQIQILFDSSHLFQVANNLCNNAINHHRQSIEHIHIQFNCNYDNELDQPYVDVIDNGPGIDAELVQQIFDPFFTTSSKGTGLGLYISKEMIESNRAKIRYIEEPEGGSCFRIHFLGSQ